MTSITKHQRTFRGAKVRQEGSAPPMATALHPQVKHHGSIGYELAMANRHKNWAKRWLRAHGKWV